MQKWYADATHNQGFKKLVYRIKNRAVTMAFEEMVRLKRQCCHVCAFVSNLKCTRLPLCPCYSALNVAVGSHLLRVHTAACTLEHTHTHTTNLKQQVRMVEETKLKLKESLLANSKLIMRWTKRPMYNCWDAWSAHAAELRRRDKVVVEHFFRCFLIPSSCLCPFLVSGSNLWISCSFSRGFGTECSMQALFWR